MTDECAMLALFVRCTSSRQLLSPLPSAQFFAHLPLHSGVTFPFRLFSTSTSISTSSCHSREPPENLHRASDPESPGYVFPPMIPLLGSSPKVFSLPHRVSQRPRFPSSPSPTTLCVPTRNRTRAELKGLPTPLPRKCEEWSRPTEWRSTRKRSKVAENSILATCSVGRGSGSFGLKICFLTAVFSSRTWNRTWRQLG